MAAAPHSRAGSEQHDFYTPHPRDESASASTGPQYHTPLSTHQSPELVGNPHPTPGTRASILYPPLSQAPSASPPVGAEPPMSHSNAYEASRSDHGYSVQQMDLDPQTAPSAVEAVEEIIIALMGVTGVGKSYFIKEISGLPEVVVGDGLESCTTTIKPYSFIYEGTKITLVDTPGFNDTHRSDIEVLKDITAWTSQTYEEKRLLSGVIYLHRITDVRMEGSALKNLRMFKSLCGEDAMQNVLLTTTQWSRVDLLIGEARELELKTKEEFWKPLLDRGATLARFHGDQSSGFELIRNLMTREPKALVIQEEIVDKKMALIETVAGQIINEELIRLQNKYSEELETTKQELQAALDGKDEELKEMLAEQQASEEHKLGEIEAERRALLAQHEEELKKRDEEMRKRDEERRNELESLESQQRPAGDRARKDERKKPHTHRRPQPREDEAYSGTSRQEEAYSGTSRQEEHYMQAGEQRRRHEADGRKRSASNKQSCVPYPEPGETRAGKPEKERGGNPGRIKRFFSGSS